MRIEKQLTNNKWLNIKEIQDPENDINGYQFAERLGKDSIAFICYDERTEEILLNNEYKPPVNKFIIGSFGGSLDKDKELIDIVIDEVKEEAGYIVNQDQIEYLGKCFVSTQMNQFCHLYIVFVDKNDQGEKHPENKVEAKSKTEWLDIDRGRIISKNDDYEDWKVMAILYKSRHKGLIK